MLKEMPTMEAQRSRGLTEKKTQEHDKSLFSSYFGKECAYFLLHAKNMPQAKLQSNRLIFLAEQILKQLNSQSVIWQVVSTAMQVYNVKE